MTEPEPSAVTRGRQWLGFAILSVAGLVALGLGMVAVTMPKSCAGNTLGGGCATPTLAITSPVDGIVVTVDSSGLSDVRGFTLRTSGGLAITFVLGPLENAAEFSPSHLVEHQASSEPVRVSFRTEGGQHLVYRLEDAPGLPSP